VRVLKYTPGTPGDVTPLVEFFAYDLGFRAGIFVAAGDVNGDGKADIITGVGPGGGPHVQVVTLGAGGAPESLASFFAYDPGARAGMRVAAARLAPGDDEAAIVTVPGPGSAPHLKAFRRNPDGSVVEVLSSFAYPPTFLGGAWVTGLR
jgi:serralysin